MAGETKFTSGPLIVKGNEIHWQSRPDSITCIVARLAGGKNDDETVANAHLFAAAPDLYEAGSSAEQGITEAVRVLDLMGRGQAARDLAIYANNLRAALRKARGEPC